MENYDQEMFYWRCVCDSSELLCHAGVDIETFLSDVFDRMVKQKATAGNLVPLLALLDKLKDERQRLNAEIAKEQVYKA